MAAHRGWLETEDAWTFLPRIVLERASETLGFALLEVDYREAGTQRRFVLSLVFAREDEGEKLFSAIRTRRCNPLARFQ